MEQAKAGVSVSSARARALLPGRLTQLVTHMLTRSDNAYAKSDKKLYLRLLQDLAWITIQYRSLNRGAELSDLTVEQTCWGPNRNSLLFIFNFSKVLRDGDTHSFGVEAGSETGEPTKGRRVLRL